MANFNWRLTDGDQLALPRSKDLLKEGYCGYPCPNEMETHFLRMYLSHAYDVLSGVTKNLCFSPALNEIANAIQMIGSFESNSITLYDSFIYLQRLLRPMLKPVTSLLRVVSEALLLSPS